MAGGFFTTWANREGPRCEEGRMFRSKVWVTRVNSCACTRDTCLSQGPTPTRGLSNQRKKPQAQAKVRCSDSDRAGPQEAQERLPPPRWHVRIWVEPFHRSRSLLGDAKGTQYWRLESQRAAGPLLGRGPPQRGAQQRLRLPDPRVPRTKPGCHNPAFKHEEGYALWGSPNVVNIKSYGIPMESTHSERLKKTEVNWKPSHFINKEVRSFIPLDPTTSYILSQATHFILKRKEIKHTYVFSRSYILVHKKF